MKPRWGLDDLEKILNPICRPPVQVNTADSSGGTEPKDRSVFAPEDGPSIKPEETPAAVTKAGTAPKVYGMG